MTPALRMAACVIVFTTVVAVTGAAAQASGAERIGELRVHGNATVSDADVLRFAAVAVGDVLPADATDAIKRRLEQSGRFDEVDVRKRYRSLTDATDVSLIIIVHERTGVVDGPAVAKPFKKLQQHLMYLPIMSYADGYGLTYGARVGTQDLFGWGERLSAPLTWGATKRAALEIDRVVPRGPIDRVEGSVGVSSRHNPRFGVDDHRVDVRARAERHLPGGLRVGAEWGRANVSFGDLHDDQWTFTADAAIDTRNDPSFPRAGVLARTSWTALNLPSREQVNEYRVDVRAFQGLFGQTVLAVRGAYMGADATLPPYERLLLGGGSLLRGYRAGAFDGDRVALASLELRVPLTSALGGGRTGVTLFSDTGAAFEAHQSITDARFHHGIGAGLFFSAAIFSLNIDVARSDAGHTRGHLSFGFSF
jgi:outer membrane protein assembly factor BamA